MHRGYLKLWRALQDWEWYTDSKMVHLFIHLLIRANIRDEKWRGVEVKRGQIIVGRRVLSAETGISQQSIRTCLNRLKSTNEVTIKTTSKYSIITILEYEKYQSNDNGQPSNQPTNQPATNQQLTSNQPLIKKAKKAKNNNNADVTISDDVKKLISEYEEMSGRKVLSVSKTRANKVKSALKQFGREKIIQSWAAMSLNDFLRGRDQSNGKDYFTFDYALRPDKIEDYFNHYQKVTNAS